MAVTKQNTYVIGSNNDLSNALAMIDENRIGLDLTWLENDGGTLKVSVGSLIEAEGSLYLVETAAETPTGTPNAGDYLFFDPSVPGFVWSATRGTYDPTRGGRYDGSDRRQCRLRLTGATSFAIVRGEFNTEDFDGDLNVDGDLDVDGDLNVDGDADVDGDLDVNGEITATGALNGSKVNTGNGDFEIGQDLNPASAVEFRTIVLPSFTPSNTTNKLYQIGGTLYFNGSPV